MSEIEKLYENVGVKAINIAKNGSTYIPDYIQISGHLYPPFTAEKQIELIKWLVQNKRLCVRKAEYSNNFYMDTIINRSNGVDSKNFEVCLASQVNSLWQDLTEEEKQQVKGILE